ncbi:MAG: VWA domain-containing protein [Sandaracinaceae bacterium]|nr:VWA domain-containing protein [Sandaracinaceae bacterium]
MGFEAPLALLALAAAALPIVAHLLRRQDLPHRPLPTVVLLRRAEAASKKRVRVVDLLLLIVRVLLLALAALAIARPFFRVALAYGDGSVASVAIVIDDSMSVAGRGDPSLLSRALARAGEAVESLPPDSEVAIVLAGAPARVLVARTDELAAAARALAAVPASSARGTDLAGAVALAERELTGARHADRRLLILTDGAAHGGLAGAALPRGVTAEIERLGEDPPAENAAIVLARATPDPTTPGSASVAVEVRAQGMDGRGLVVSLRQNGEEVARQPITIASGGARATLHARLDPSDPSGCSRSTRATRWRWTTSAGSCCDRPPAPACWWWTAHRTPRGRRGRPLPRARDRSRAGRCRSAHAAARGSRDLRGDGSERGGRGGARGGARALGAHRRAAARARRARGRSPRRAGRGLRRAGVRGALRRPPAGAARQRRRGRGRGARAHRGHGAAPRRARAASRARTPTGASRSRRSIPRRPWRSRSATARPRWRSGGTATAAWRCWRRRWTTPGRTCRSGPATSRWSWASCATSRRRRARPRRRSRRARRCVCARPPAPRGWSCCGRRASAASTAARR